MPQLLFTSESGPVSSVIKTLTWSDFSHVDLVFGDVLIGAVPFRGVVEDTLFERIAAATQIAVYDIPGLDDEVALSFAKSQLGKPYDWAGAIGVGLHRDWQDPERWFCSEFVEWVCTQSGHPLLAGNFRRITPRDLTLSPLIQIAEK
jgi:hypothetical protein